LKEKLVADEVQDDTNYDATNKKILDGTAGKYHWSDTTNGTPLEDIDDGRRAIRADIGLYPDTLELGEATVSALQRHPDIRNMLSPIAGQQAIVTQEAVLQLLKNLFGFKNVVIGLPMYTTGPTGTLTDIWLDNAVMAYVGTPANQDEQNFGALLSRNGYPKMYNELQPLTRGLKVIQIQEAFAPHAINWDAGYLVKNTVL
jgi:hypothetical protein